MAAKPSLPSKPVVAESAPAASAPTAAAEVDPVISIHRPLNFLAGVGVSQQADFRGERG